jgi:hypothetical protein
MCVLTFVDDVFERSVQHLDLELSRGANVRCMVPFIYALFIFLFTFYSIFKFMFLFILIQIPISVHISDITEIRTGVR